MTRTAPFTLLFGFVVALACSLNAAIFDAKRPDGMPATSWEQGLLQVAGYLEHVVPALDICEGNPDKCRKASERIYLSFNIVSFILVTLLSIFVFYFYVRRMNFDYMDKKNNGNIYISGSLLLIILAFVLLDKKMVGHFESRLLSMFNGPGRKYAHSIAVGFWAGLFLEFLAQIHVRRLRLEPPETGGEDAPNK